MTLRGRAVVGQLWQRWRGSGLLLLGLTLLLAASFATSAQAAGESIYITPPTSAKVDGPYSFTVSGYAPQSERLYFFDDIDSCGPSPYVEHSVHNAIGDDLPVNGNFQYVLGGWESSTATTYYACAYLVDASAPANPSAGVLAQNFQSFAVESARRPATRHERSAIAGALSSAAVPLPPRCLRIWISTINSRWAFVRPLWGHAGCPHGNGYGVIYRNRKGRWQIDFEASGKSCARATPRPHQPRSPQTVASGLGC
jgi:hypothetical protein